MIYYTGYVMFSPNTMVLRPSHRATAAFNGREEALLHFSTLIDLSPSELVVENDPNSPLKDVRNSLSIMLKDTPEDVKAVVGYYRETTDKVFFLSPICDCKGCRKFYNRLKSINV